MKKIIIVFVIFITLTFLIIGNKKEKEVLEAEEKRSAFISYIELEDYIDNKDELSSKEVIDKMISNLKDTGFNMIILHVRPFSDAIYESNIYPVSHVLGDNEGDLLKFDVLEYFIKVSHENDIELHAWINPYRIRTNTDVTSISIKNPAYKYIGTNHVKVIEDKGIYYNPASSEVQELILEGIKEIITNYEVDGIHFDDYFYPDKTIDLDNYDSYVKDGGSLSIDEYRLENVTTLIRKVYSLIKEYNPDILFGISPEGNITNNYNRNYLDVKKILSSEGYIDYIMPQIYYGFNNGVKPFGNTLKEWKELITVDTIKLLPALGLYKSGKYDTYAKSGSNEWIDNNDIISRQIEMVRDDNACSGFSIFSYNYLFNEEYLNDNLSKEVEKIFILTRK